MLNWIYSLFRQSMSGLTQLWNWVVSAFSAVYSYIDIEIRMIEREAIDAWNYAYQLFQAADRFAQQIYVALGDALTQIYRDIISWVTRVWNDVYTYAVGVYRQLVKWAGYLGALIIRLERDIVAWVLKNIWDPLYRDITGAINWIGKEGAYIWNLVTHPDLIVKLLGHYLWLSWQDMLKKDGKTAARWILHSTLGLGRELASIIETIITGIL